MFGLSRRCLKKVGEPCCEWGDKTAEDDDTYCKSTAGQRDQLFPFVSQLLVLVELTTGLLSCVVYWWQTWSKGNLWGRGWEVNWFLAVRPIKATSSKSSNQSFPQPSLPLFFCLCKCQHSVISRAWTQSEMDESRRGWRGVEMVEKHEDRKAVMFV